MGYQFFLQGPSIGSSQSRKVSHFYMIGLLFVMAILNQSISYASHSSHIAFENGAFAQFTFDDVDGFNGVTVFDPNGQKSVKSLLLTTIPTYTIDSSYKNRIIHNETIGAQEYSIESKKSPLIFTAKEGIFALLPSGAILEIFEEIEMDELEQSFSGLSFSYNTFDYKNHSFFVAHFNRKSGPGHLVIIRDDGVIVRSAGYIEEAGAQRTLHTQITTETSSGTTSAIAVQSHEVPILIEDNGFLHILRETERKLIDLDRFEAEAHFESAAAQTIHNEQGEVIKLEQFVGKFTTNWTNDSALLRRAIPINNSNREIVIAIRRALAKRHIGSAALLGEAGTGKTTVAETFTAAVKRGEFPEIPRTTEVLYLSSSQLSAGTKFVGSTEARASALVEYCKTRPVILVLDEAHSMRGVGTHSGQQSDIFQSFKAAMANGSMRMIAMSTAAEFNKAFKGDAPLYQRFAIIEKPMLDRAETITALKFDLGKANKQTSQKISLTDEQLELIYDLSFRFNSTGAQPRSAIDLLDTIIASHRIFKNQSITSEDVLKTAKEYYHLSAVQLYAEELRSAVVTLKQALQEKLPTHAVATEALVEQSLHSGTHPIHSFFVGSSGLGQTDMAKLYAQSLGLSFSKIDMRSYNNPYAIDKFFEEMAQVLSSSLSTVIYLDGFEKASGLLQEKLAASIEAGFFHSSYRIDSTNHGSQMVRISLLNAPIIFGIETDLGNYDGNANSATRRIGFHVGSSQIQNQSRRLDLDFLEGLSISESLLDSSTGLVPFYNFSKDDYMVVLEKAVEQELLLLKAEHPFIVPAMSAHNIAERIFELSDRSIGNLKSAKRLVSQTLRSLHRKFLYTGEDCQSLFLKKDDAQNPI